VADLHAAVRGQEDRHHQRVLLADAAPQFGQHSRRHSQIDRDRVGVAGAASTAGQHQQIVFPSSSDQFFQQR